MKRNKKKSTATHDAHGIAHIGIFGDARRKRVLRYTVRVSIPETVWKEMLASGSSEDQFLEMGQQQLASLVFGENQEYMRLSTEKNGISVGLGEPRAMSGAAYDLLEEDEHERFNQRPAAKRTAIKGLWIDRS